MLLKLIPVAPQPTVLFSISFRNIEAQGVDALPPAWNTQLRALLIDELEVPQGTHALDKAAGIPSLLDEVVFDVPALTVSCRFLDGALEEWPLMERICLEKLDRVVADVSQSAQEAQREQLREDVIREINADRVRECASRDLHSQRRHHHHQQKKCKSLFRSIVSSIVPSHPLPSPSAPRTSAKLVLEELEASASGISARALRRRARSTLVDVFRRYVLPELSSRFPPGGYYTWVAASMIRRAHARMEELVQQAAREMPEASLSYHRAHMSATAALSPDDDYDDETDTDGSSIRTPSSSGRPRSSYYSTISSCSSYAPDSSPPLPPQEQDEYTAFSSLVRRLQHLLIAAQYQREQEEDELRAQDLAVEVRSRRRAWLNKQLVAPGSGDIGHSSPYRSSRLAQASWSGDDYVHQPVPPPPPPPALTYSRRLIYESDSDAEDEDEDARELELTMGVQALNLNTHRLSLQHRLDDGGGVEVRKPPLPAEAAILRQMELGFEAGIPEARGLVHVVQPDEWAIAY
ncbi:hypothetical protein BD626DRAFT_534992 [Schizophyllum amplum]|uniref:Uncharacterized protein n=1 Tax=Schizophyllum amplum TaxID=97359 RepID=A0A550CQ68_9AGAR|nr:hypothetical protein BD626DRAFT_534992 [Auriculariopsis ampla]